MTSNRKSDEAYAEIRQRIMLAELPPSSLIDEKSLLDDLGIGRTPLREAILRLAQEGLVTAMGRRGYVVAGASATDQMLAYELRREIECFTAGLAAERRSEDDVARIDAFLTRIAAEVQIPERDTSGDLAIDEEFHDLIATASGNPFAKRFLASLYGLSVRSLYVSRIPITMLSDELENYRAALNAIRMRDVQAARAAMAQHLTVGPIQFASGSRDNRRQAM